MKWTARDGDSIEAGIELGRVSGALRSLLAGERVALNFLTHSSGVALAHAALRGAARGKARIRDTRKTIPGMRAVQKAAVRAGGGFNHRDSLSDAVLVKDNHLAVLGLRQSVERTRARWPGRIIEVECDSLEQVTDACNVGVDLVLLDNMSPEDVTRAVGLCNGAVEGGGLRGRDARHRRRVRRDRAPTSSPSARSPTPLRGLDIGLDIL